MTWSNNLSAAAVSLAFLLLPTGVTLAQQGIVPVQELSVPSLVGCRGLLPRLKGNESGGQWLVGDGIELKGQPNAPGAITVLRKAMTKVNCYNEASPGGVRMVFVSNDDGSLCGWVRSDALLPEYRLGSGSGQALQGLRSRAVCETPRAMPFSEYCRRYGTIGQGGEVKECEGVPAQLRTKGVLIGTVAENTDLPQYPMLSAPSGGKKLSSKTFFSVLEVHDIQRGPDDEAMLLVGDGAGDLFGWIDRRALRLWPTRLGLYYDEATRGGMFLQESRMRENARKGAPPPEVIFDGTTDDLNTFLHGRLPLLAYPIIRTVDPSKDPLLPPGPAWHEVIFVGKTGETSASQLLNQVDLSNRIQQLSRVNIAFVVDATESMTEYLPYIRNGIAEFIRSYNHGITDAANRLPDMRLAVVAYADYIDKQKMSFGDQIKTEVVMQPTTIGPEYDTSTVLRGIETYGGLTDDVGGWDEAALEAVVKVASGFETGSWFEDGPRVVIHIGDHGSRSGVSVNRVVNELGRRNVLYIPIQVITDDQGNSERQASGGRFGAQALELLAPLIERGRGGAARPGDVPRIELTDRSSATAGQVADLLDKITKDVVATINHQRGAFIASTDPGSAAAAEVLDKAASRLRIDKALEEQYGLSEATLKAMAQADRAFAPMALRQGDLQQSLDWTYFVAFEPEQVDFLQPALRDLCQLSGRPDQRKRFRGLIVRMAEFFSGDKIEHNNEVSAVLSDLATLEGVRGSFLSIPGQQLLQRIDSEDPAVQEQMRKDVCWISYNLNNVRAGLYARPRDLVWDPQNLLYQLAPGRSANARNYSYVPLVGAPMVYLPSWMFAVPSQVETAVPGSTGCSGWTCN